MATWQYPDLLTSLFITSFHPVSSAIRFPRRFLETKGMSRFLDSYTLKPT
jgi:hypothetical protein